MKLSIPFIFCLFFILIGFAEVKPGPSAFATEKTSALLLFDGYLKEVYRLDGDGLIPRGNRKLSYPQIAKNLRRDLQQAKTIIPDLSFRYFHGRRCLEL